MVLSKWGALQFASKRYDEETDFIYFGRRYYSPNIGRWITADPQGFDDGPNLYAYVHDSPFTTLDLHGLFSWWNSWTGMKNFGVGVGKHTWGMVAGVGYAAVRMGEWMVADSFYEAGDPSYFHAKSRASSERWKSFGSAVYNDPIGTGGRDACAWAYGSISQSNKCRKLGKGYGRYSPDWGERWEVSTGKQIC